MPPRLREPPVPPKDRDPVCTVRPWKDSQLERDENADYGWVITETPEPNTSSLVNPSSALLQDLLKEQRATRGARPSGLEELEDSPQRTPEWCHSQSRSHSQEDAGSEKQPNTKMSSTGSVRQPREMGLRETDQVGIDKIPNAPRNGN
jgi:hypothetical protein